MVTIDPATFNDVVNLLKPHLAGLTARQTFVTQALYDAPLLIHNINYEGDTHQFAVNLVRECETFGQIMPGRLAIIAVLEHLRGQTSENNQGKIDNIIFEFTFAQPQTPFEFVGSASEEAPHIFISYSRSDMPFIQRMVRDLQGRGVNVWVDHVGLKPGTSDWENALRSAIQSADGIVLVASPASRKSPYVRDELAIARAARRPVYPVWAAGEIWSDSIPMGMGSIQYVD